MDREGERDRYRDIDKDRKSETDRQTDIHIRTHARAHTRRGEEKETQRENRGQGGHGRSEYKRANTRSLVRSPVINVVSPWANSLLSRFNGVLYGN